MGLTDTPAAYGPVSRFNHWVGGVLVLALLGIGLYFHGMPRGDERFWWMGLHIGLGTLAFLLLAFRVLWRMFTPSPRSVARRPWLQRASRWTHWLLLGLIAILILSGPLTVWSNGRPLDVFGWFQVASPMLRQPELHEALEEIHGFTSRLLLVTLILHVVAALWHALFERNRDVMARMLGTASR